jgi:predicted transcriptional regulator
VKGAGEECYSSWRCEDADAATDIFCNLPQRRLELMVEVLAMSYQMPPNIQQLIDHKMATGLYATQDQLLLQALQSLDDYEEAVADIREGMEDELAGRTISLAEAEREIRQELGLTS